MKPPPDGAEAEQPAIPTAGETPRAVGRRPLRFSRRARLTAAFLFGMVVMAGLGWSFFQPVGSRVAARWFLQQAQAKQNKLDFPSAMADLDRAVELLPDVPDVYFIRADFRREAGDLTGSLADFNKLIELNPYFARGYLQRSSVYQRLGRHREAIDDLTKAIELRPAWDPQPLNNRAYARAVAHAVIDRQELEAGLADIERAIALADSEDAALLDTRGYLYHLLGQQEKALADLDRAIALSETERAEVRKQGPVSPWQARLLDRSLAVMFQHRGLVQQRLGHTSQAEQDLQRAKELGYDEAQGVF